MTVSRTIPSAFAAPLPDLADVLHSLGHDCPLGCARASDELGATVWLTRIGLPVSGRDDPTLVVVDSTASFAPPNRSYHLVRFVDRRARTDGIRVRERRASDVPTTSIPL
ncbi:MAG TPA: hypothetical protein VIJ41_12115 [Candidatus Nanopelagicales bacterium]|jgi:hypothetical protein